eukprot:TRINITY_DN1851_c1_g2_i1.p1 TRINITY_DN1851_c1_g2~~TRINITY_DN1851_c1_g2_i1.p1  ORF type:complete len:403 (+),score=77.21 TRINITY_DN1851_c1_g2_i1:30-1238(+)
MSALKFLGKKSWHTGTIQNQEKVWIAEQKKNEEDKKVAILKKQIEEERQIEELKDLAASATGRARPKRVDWMYDAPGMLGGPSAEEYLQGKVYEPQAQTENDVSRVQEAKAPGALFIRGQVDPGRDMERKVRDDPLMEIKRREKSSLQSILDNPLKMLQLQKSLLLKQQSKAKPSKKEKRDKKDRKHAHSSPSRDERRHKRSRSRSKSPPATTTTTAATTSRPSTSSRRSRSRSPRRRSPSPRRRSRSPPRDGPAHHSHHHHHHHGSTSSRRSRSPRRSPPRRSRSRSPPRRRSRSPPRQYQQRRSGGTAKVSELTEEERQRRLAQMQANAMDLREERISSAQKGLETEEPSINTGTNSSFLGSMQRAQTFDEEQSLQDRLHRNRHYIQRTPGEETNGFRKH